MGRWRGGMASPWLYQQVLYDRVPVGRRAGLHRRLGARQEAAYGARAANTRRRWRCTLSAGGSSGRAVHYRRQAADTALRRYAYREAVGASDHGAGVAREPARDPRTRQAGAGPLDRPGPALIRRQRPGGSRSRAHLQASPHPLPAGGGHRPVAPALVGLRVWYSMRGMPGSPNARWGSNS